MASSAKRRQRDVMRLMMSDYDVQVLDEPNTVFTVAFNGPADSPYEGGVWQLRVELMPEYPFKSPSIGFLNRLFHPNVDERSGSVCLDVINQTWSPMYDLINVFDVFLPQLLLYPNPTDPLNTDAARLLLHDPAKYAEVVKEYVVKYASGAAAPKGVAAGGSTDGSKDSTSVSEPASSAGRRDTDPSGGGGAVEADSSDSDDDSDVSDMSDL